MKWVIALAFAGFVALVLFGSIKRIAKVAEKISPLKGILYLACAIIIVVANLDNLVVAAIQHCATDNETGNDNRPRDT